MNRRGFFKALAGAAVTLSAGGIALLEEELWQPTKTIMLPPKQGWVAADYGYSRVETNASFGLSNGYLNGFSNAFPSMEKAMQRAMEGYEEEGAPAFVIWQRPYQSPTRRVVYSSL